MGKGGAVRVWGAVSTHSCPRNCMDLEQVEEQGDSCRVEPHSERARGDDLSVELDGSPMQVVGGLGAR